jgi:hypothetical protein
MKIKVSLVAAFILAFASINFAQTKNAAPETVVKNLYAAQKAKKDIFFQSKSRVMLDKFFTKNFADIVWKDMQESKKNNEPGNLDFDPFYNAQDFKITAFKVGAPDYGEGNRKLADVPVKFKNFGKAETILFRLEQTGGVWKISDIFYPSSNTSLKAVLSQ